MRRAPDSRNTRGMSGLATIPRRLPRRRQQVAARADRVVGRLRTVVGNSLLFSSGHSLRVLATRWLGASTHGFPYLSGAGRLIIKDAIMLGAAVVTLSDSARVWWARNP